MPSYYASKMQKKADALCGCGCSATMQKPFSGEKEVVFCEECYWDDFEDFCKYEDERRQRHAENKEQVVGRTRSWTIFKREMAEVGEEVRQARWFKAIKDEAVRRQEASLWAARFVYDEVLARRDQAVTIILKLQGKTTTTRASFVAFVVACKRAYLDYDKVAAEELAARIKYNGMLDEC